MNEKICGQFSPIQLNQALINSKEVIFNRILTAGSVSSSLGMGIASVAIQ
jgi:hypothetical protein